ncbi:MAG: glycerophosphodiester phosphodiesterase [Chlorobiaceae bacterium]|nr:glycerophosphodiester phosphodiesterase [Chlorobiaceae bacterium]
MLFEIQAHRGARAFYPENTIQAFCKAADLGCRVVELDLVASKDRRILVSHDPWIPAGDDGKPSRQLFFTMDYRDIAAIDCGTPSPDFPQQQRIAAYRPLLSEVFREVEAHLCRIGRPGAMVYNLEVKSRAGLEGVAFPPPGEYAGLVAEVIRDSGLSDRVRVQSFDPRIVAETRRLMPELRVGLLVEELSALEGFPEGIGFVPDYVNPHRSLVDRPLVDMLHRHGSKVVAWTVNAPEEMNRMKLLGVDGLITDHPETALGLPALSAL